MKNRAGLTLLELTVALAIFMLVMGLTFVVAFGGNSNERALQNASLALQADMRYAQRRAVAEDRNFYISFELEENRYQIFTRQPMEIHRTVYMPSGVTLRSTNFPSQQMHYLPRGTTGPRAGTIVLYAGRFRQELTTTVSGGRVKIHPIKEVN